MNAERPRLGAFGSFFGFFSALAGLALFFAVAFAAFAFGAFAFFLITGAGAVRVRCTAGQRGAAFALHEARKIRAGCVRGHTLDKALDCLALTLARCLCSCRHLFAGPARRDG